MGRSTLSDDPAPLVARGLPARRKDYMDFGDLGLPPRLTEQLKQQGITCPTPVQAQAIPHALERRDVVGLAQTGTGGPRRCCRATGRR